MPENTVIESAVARRRGFPLPALLVGLVVFALTTAAILWNVQREDVRARAEVEGAATNLGSELQARLGQALDRRIFVVQAIRGYALGLLQAEGKVDEEGWQEFASALVARANVPLRSVQLAPDAVVTYVHPLAGNEEAVGHDLLGDDARRDAVLAGIENGTFVIAGPFELLQGGRGLVARAPIYVGESEGLETFWGFATVVADYDPILDEVGLDTQPEGFDVALRGKDARGADGDVFLGDGSVFEDGLVYDVRLPSGSWQLAVRPTGGWDAAEAARHDFLLWTGLVLAVLLGGLAAWVLAGRQRAADLSRSLAAVMEAAPIPILSTDAAGRVDGGNAAALRAFDVALGSSLPEHEHLGPLVRDVLAGDDVEHRAVELELDDRDGRRRVLLVDVVRRTDRIGGPVVVASDLTDRREVERVRAENQAILDAARLKDEFLAGMSHELRTPLNGIIGLSQLLETGTVGELEPKQHEFVTQIGVSGRHLLSLINDVLDLAKIESDTVDLDVGAVRLADVVDDVRAMMLPQAEAKGLTCHLDVPADVVLRADERRVRQVLLNLCGNAVKFTPDGGEVGVRATMEGNEVRIDVWDTGIGIAPEHRNLLFKPFVQVDSSLDREHGGTGLGLSLSQRLVELQDGRIDFTSEVGQGSTFSVWLPARVERSTPDQDATRPQPPRPAGQPTLVLAEDNEVNRLLMVEHLTAAGWQVDVAGDGEEAVALVRRVRPDIVVMDVQMPTVDGLEATRRLKADASTRGIPIVAVTALAMRGDEERCLAAGCDAYVSKPVELGPLTELLVELAGRDVAPLP